MAIMPAELRIYSGLQEPALSEINYKEIHRYAGMGKAIYDCTIDISQENELIEECLREVAPFLTYKVSYIRDVITWNEGEPCLPFNSFNSQNVKSSLNNCDEIVMFAATLGIGIDRLITKYNHISGVKALFLQAIGAERIEALCNLFNSQISMEAQKVGKKTHPRFSPGYGDLPLAVQKDFFALLDCDRKLGLTLNESLLMSPSKSVTAFIGIEP